MEPNFLSQRVQRGDYYFLDLSPAPTSGLAVVCGGREVCDSTYVVDRANFRYQSLEFVASGQGVLVLEGRRHELGPGSVFCYGPGVAHRIEASPASSMVKYFVDFSGELGAELLARAFPESRPGRVTATGALARLFEDLKASADSLQASRAEVCSLIVRQILVLLTDRSVAQPNDPGSGRFRALKEKLRELATQGFGLEQAARECGVSPSYLARLFRRFDQQTPHQFLVQCRMALAASLLLDPQLLVKEVAALTGYDDPYHFSRCFKTVYGQSPEGFRRLRS
ncbi:MAG: AraC family transcriptional regulator [Spirochaetales bacterium]